MVAKKKPKSKTIRKKKPTPKKKSVKRVSVKKATTLLNMDEENARFIVMRNRSTGKCKIFRADTEDGIVWVQVFPESNSDSASRQECEDYIDEFCPQNLL